jgi:predicted transcriptional regulator
MLNCGKKRMRYRSRTEIISHILEAANGRVNITKTRLMYKVFLSQSQLKDYVKVLTENDLLRYDSVTRTFKTSEKGLRFLDLYNQIDRLMKEEEGVEEQQI